MEKRISFRTLLQELFLTYSFFIQNDLLTYASSCAFGFLFSFIPVVIMTAAILIRILHASPDILHKLFSSDIFASSTLDLPEIVNSFLQVEGSILFEVVIGVSLLWMARRFFNSVVKGLHCIFHMESKRRPVVWQMGIILGEVLLVVVLALLIFVFTTAESLMSTDLLRQIIPQFVRDASSWLLRFVPAGLMFCFVAVTFRVGSGTKPSGILCMVLSAACTLLFSGFLFVFSYFVDMTRYNLIYGILSNSIVLLLEVFTFFILFLFFAQGIFVHQFFDQLLLAELYLLPSRDSIKFSAAIRRMMFIKPDYFIRNKSSLITCPAGSVIFSEGDESNDVFYVAEGSVRLTKTNRIAYCDRGGFFGEFSCILARSRDITAIAETDVKILRVEADTFTAMLEKNPAASRKALAQISAYFAVQSVRD